MATTQEFCSVGGAPATRSIGKRLEEIAWAVFLIMTGAMWLAPEASIPEGAWLAGVGLILLGLNAGRRLYRLRMSGFGIIVGFVALAAGIGHILNLGLPFLPVLLVITGAAIIVKAVVRPGKSDGTAGVS